MRAAVLHEIGREELDVHDDAVGFGPGKVRVQVRATGLCHSDLSAMSRTPNFRRGGDVFGFAGTGTFAEEVERPRVRAKFDSRQETFTYDELDALLTPHYAARPPGETFAAAQVLGLRRG